jgi:hypothetical protein
MAQFNQLMLATGHGIGSIAAHETAHQLVSKALMDCVQSCESKDVYESATSSGANGAWLYTDDAQYRDGYGNTVIAHLKWGSKVRDAIQAYLLPTNK